MANSSEHIWWLERRYGAGSKFNNWHAMDDHIQTLCGMTAVGKTFRKPDPQPPRSYICSKCEGIRRGGWLND